MLSNKKQKMLSNKKGKNPHKNTERARIDKDAGE